jgi:hypothetical protein
MIVAVPCGLLLSEPYGMIAATEIKAAAQCGMPTGRLS